MKSAAAVLLVLLAGSTYEPAIAFFSRARDVTHISVDDQSYFVVDSDIWKFARPDLADLRLYDGESQVPYALKKQTGGSSREESAAKLLNLGAVAGHTEFDLDVRGMSEYSRVRLNLEAKNFISTAQVQGRQSPNDRLGTDLGSTTLYDFTAEGLGSNFVLKCPEANFPYLHVRLAPGIRPAQIKGAYIASFSETKTAWLSAGNCLATSGPPKQGVFECSTSPGMPVERLAFQIEPGTVNFNRAVVVSDEKGDEIERGYVSRVRLTRAGQTVTSQELAIDLYPRTGGKLRVAIENGDDQPLRVQQVQALSVERRVYFNPAGKTALRLYYGDQKLNAPSYDYAKFFEPSTEASVAQLGEAVANSRFTGRPDERPWSERHTFVLWAAMLIAVGVLAVLAVRGLARDKQIQPR
jgi:hypothetical protein